MALSNDHGIWSHHFIATRWGNSGNSVRLYFLGLQNHCKLQCDCNHEIKTLAPCKKSYDQPRQHVKKQRYYFTTKGPSIQSYGFPVVLYGCESWTIKKAECRKIDSFELWCCRRLLRVPWTARRSNQSISKEISPGCSLEGMMLKLKLQYFVHLMRRTDSFEKTRYWERLKARGEWDDDRGCDGRMSSQLNGHGFGWTLGVGDGQGGLACCSSWGHKDLETTE